MLKRCVIYGSIVVETSVLVLQWLAWYFGFIMSMIRTLSAATSLIIDLSIIGLIVFGYLVYVGTIPASTVNAISDRVCDLIFRRT